MPEGEQEYREAVDEFWEIFNTIRKKYGLMMEGHFSVYPNDDDWLAIWHTEHGRKTEIVFKETGEDEAECYKKAAKDLRFWHALKEEKKRREKGICLKNSENLIP